MKQAYFIFLIATCSILIYKTVHYWRHFSGKNVICWLFFGRSEVLLSSTANRRIAKERQNTLSVILVVSAIFTFCLYFLLY